MSELLEPTNLDNKQLIKEMFLLKTISIFFGADVGNLKD